MLEINVIRHATLLFLILVNSGFLFLTDDKIAGIPFFREAFIFSIATAALVLMVFWKKVHHSKAAAWIVFFGIVLPFCSALLAKINWDQPIIYGLLEERRNFAYLIFFPIYYLLIKIRPSQSQIQLYVLISGMACVAIGFLYYFKIIPQNSNVFFEVDAKDGADVLRPDRYRIGATYVSICALTLMYSIKRRLTFTKISLLAVFALYLWVVLQTRNVMVIWALSFLWIFRDRPFLIARIALTFGIFLAAVYSFSPEFIDAQYNRIFALISQATDEPGVRNNTIALSLADVAKNNFLGLGALSLQWKDGFARIYSEYFYLADVGIVGIYYRFGFFTPAIAGIFYFGFIFMMRNCRTKSDLLLAFQIDFAFSILNIFLSNSIMFGGDILGLAAAIFLYCYESTNTASLKLYYSQNDTIPHSYNKS
jgi:hypothetical protein